MGQQMMIIALLASFLVSTAVLGLRSSWNDSVDIAATQHEEEQVLNLSASGVNMSISQLRQQKTWRAGFSNLAVTHNGTVSVTVTDIGQDSVRIASTAEYNNRTHTSVVDVELGAMVPMAESALAIYGDEVHFDNSGKAFGIDGNDHAANGSAGTAPPVHGISIPNSSIESQLEAQLIKDKVYKNVSGQGGWPSVGVATITNQQVIEMRDFFKNMATNILTPGHHAGNATYGSLDAPAVVYVGGDLRWTGKISGTGVLVVDGSAKLGGNVNWTGLVIAVAHDVDLEFGDHGSPTINGAAMVGTEVPSNYKVTNVKINGNPQLNYSNEALTKVMQNLSLTQVHVLNYYE